jgi:ATP-dependent Clp protease ATP-binding subunit ClpC
LAQEEARLLNHNFIGTEHLLLGLIHEGEGVAAKALESLGISPEAVRDKVEETVGPAASSTPRRRSPRKRRRCSSCRFARRCSWGTTMSGPSTCSSGWCGDGESVAAQVLLQLGADLSRVRQQVIELLSG